MLNIKPPPPLFFSGHVIFFTICLKLEMVYVNTKCIENNFITNYISKVNIIYNILFRLIEMVLLSGSGCAGGLSLTPF